MFTNKRIKFLEDSIKQLEGIISAKNIQLEEIGHKQKQEKVELIHLLKMKEEKMNVENEKHKYTIFRDDCVRQLAVKEAELKEYRENYRQLHQDMKEMMKLLVETIPTKKGR